MPFINVSTQIIPINDTSIDTQQLLEYKKKILLGKNKSNNDNNKSYESKDELVEQNIIFQEDIVQPTHIVEDDTEKEIISDKKNKKKILFVGHDFKFVNELISFLKDKYYIKTDVWTNYNKHDKNTSIKLLNWADIIFCEWCLGNAVFYSKNKKPKQKLFVRLHRIEITTNYIFKVIWKNVDKLITVGPNIYEKIIKIIPEMKNKTTINYNNINNYNLSNKSENSKFNLGLLGYLPSLKRIDLCIDLLYNLIKIDNRYKLYIKGKRPEQLKWLIVKDNEKEYYESIKNKINMLKLTDYIIYEEYSNNDLKEWFNKIGFILSSSDVESFHKAVAEGMLTGCIPIIFGDFYKKGGANLIFPNEYCCENIDFAKNLIIKFNNNDDIRLLHSDKVKQFISNNFLKENVFNHMIDIIESKKTYTITKLEYNIVNKDDRIIIYTDINPNTIDGSSIWLSNLINMLLYDDLIQPDILCILKHNLSRSSVFIKNINKINKVYFIEPKEYSEYVKDKDNLLTELINKFKPKSIFIRGTIETICSIDDNIIKYVTLYPLNNYDKILDKLQKCKYISVQTDIIKNQVSNLENIDNNKIFNLYPIIKSKNKIIKNNDVIRIIYTGTVRDEYDSINMFEQLLLFSREYSNKYKIEYHIAISKIYYTDKTKQLEVEHLINKMKQNNFKIYYQLSQQDIDNLYNISHIGLHWRNPYMDNCPELSTKLIEFINNDILILANNNAINKNILGSDYPYLIDNIKDINMLNKMIDDIISNNIVKINYNINEHYIDNINKSTLKYFVC